MLIKTRNYVGKEDIVLVNVDVDKNKLIRVEGNKLIFSESGNIVFKTEEQAISAMERIFERYGNMSPLSKSIDLTIEYSDENTVKEVVEEEK